MSASTPRPRRYLRYLAVVLLFGVWALALNVLCAILLPLGVERRRPGVIRRILADSMSRYRRLFEILGVGRVRFTNVRVGLPDGPCLIVANHTGLLDALFLLIELPHVVCVFKSSLRRNPFFAYMIKHGGFIANDDGMESLHAMEKALGEGRQVLVFPEGTRTDAPPMGRFKAGFAWVAKKTEAPVCALLIRNPSGLLCKRGGLFYRYSLPFECEFRNLGIYRPGEDEKAPLFARRLESLFRDELAKEDFSQWPKR